MTVDTTTTDRLTDLATGTRNAWAAFVDAVQHDSGAQVLDTYRAYWRMRRDTLAQHAADPYEPDWTAPPEPPRLVGDEHTLRAEREWLTGHAQAYSTGIVPGRATSTVGTDSSRAYTEEERAEYKRRAEAYPVALGAWNASVRAYDRHFNRETWQPGGPNKWGFSSPAASPAAPPPQQPRPLRPAPELPGSDDFSTALTAALTTEIEG